MTEEGNDDRAGPRTTTDEGDGDRRREDNREGNDDRGGGQ